jgi:signal transduction histidine kinase
MSPNERRVAESIREGIREDQSREYHLAKRKLPEENEYFYLFYDTEDLELHHRWIARVISQLILMLVVFILIAVGIGWLLSHRIFAPLSRLHDLVNDSDPKNLPTRFAEQFYPDEVGNLARTLEKALQRIEAFLARERQFTRDASHELRTPVTVIKGALEIMQQHEACRQEALARPLSRITRNLKEMEHLIETFLWLARETPPDKAPPIELKPLVTEVIARHRHLLDNKDVAVTMREKRPTKVCVPPPILKIVVGNLIRNAFHFTNNGEVRVILVGEHLEVVDTGPGLAATETDTHEDREETGACLDKIGFGIGLTIVKRFCDRYGWSLEMESRPGKGTTARLFFDSNHP